MALDQNAKYPVGTLPATAAYPEGSAVNSTAPGALDGYPLEKDQLNDRFGLEQALLRAGGQAASGIPDTALTSQYMQMIVELASGRAINYDETGAVNAYVLDLRANQQGPQSLFDGLRVRFTPSIINTGASTINVSGLGVVSLKDETGAALPSGYLQLVPYEAVYDSGAAEFRIDPTSSIGNGQSWQDLLASRAYTTTYFNTTGKSIEVLARGSASGVALIPTVGGVVLAGVESGCAFIVPPGASYSITAASGSLAAWSELR